MPHSADIGSKRLVALKPIAWARWLTDDPTIETGELVTGEFQWLSRTEDVLVKVVSPQGGRFLIANEIQLRPDRHIDLRMRAYAALAEERYRLRVYPVVVNILPPRGQTPIIDRYQSEFMGLIARQDFKVINLWEEPVSLVFERDLTALLPFVPILQGGQTEGSLEQALRLIRADQDMAELEPLLAFFASFVFDTETVQRIMRWDMAVLRESPWYQEILEEGLERGLEQGLERGLEQGLERGLERGLEQGLEQGLERGLERGRRLEREELLVRILKRRFGDAPAELSQQISELETEQLSELLDVVLEASSLAQVEAFLRALLANESETNQP